MSSSVQSQSSRINMFSPVLLLVVPIVSSLPTPGPFGSFSYQPYQPSPVYSSVSAPRIKTNPGSLTSKYKVAKSASRFNTNSGSLSTKYKQAILNTQSQSFVRTVSGSDDIVKQTRAQAESLKDDLRSMARNPRASEILNKVFSDRNNVCIKSMSDAIDAIETSTKLFENAGSEIKQLVDILAAFEKNNDTPAAVI